MQQSDVLKEGQMTSKYDLHWVRIKAGHYRLSNGNYDIEKRRDGWAVTYFDLWTATRRTLAEGLQSYSDAKKWYDMHEKYRK